MRLRLCVHASPRGAALRAAAGPAGRRTGRTSPGSREVGRCSRFAQETSCSAHGAARTAAAGRNPAHKTRLHPTERRFTRRRASHRSAHITGASLESERSHAIVSPYRFVRRAGVGGRGLVAGIPRTGFHDGSQRVLGGRRTGRRYALTGEGTAAADPDILPLGTRVRVRDEHGLIGEFVITDTGPKVQGHKIDLYYRSDAEAREFGRRRVKVEVLEWGEGHESAREEAAEGLAPPRKNNPAKPD